MKQPCLAGLWNARGVHNTALHRAKLPTIMEWGRLAKCDFLANTPTKAAGVALIALNQRLKVVPIATGLAGRLLVAQVVDQESQDSIKVGVLYAMDSGKGDAAME